RVDEDGGDRLRISDRADGELGSAVKTEPAHPEDEGAKRGERDGGTRHRVHTAALDVLAKTGSENDRAHQRSPAARRVHDGGAREIGEAHFAQPAATPLPGTLDRVDESGEEKREDHEGPELHTFGDRARYDRGGGC